jgi:type I restriction enzyme, S subunit
MIDELPQGWTTAPLREVVAARKGKKPKVLHEIAAPDRVPYLLIDQMEGNPARYFTGDPKVTVASKDDVLVVWDGSIGKCAAGLEGAVGSTIVVLKPVGVESGFLEAFIKLARRTLLETSRGTGLQHINQEVFWELEFPLAPFAEQQRILLKLEKLLGKVDDCQQRLAKIPLLLKRFRQAVLAAACSGRLTAGWREENVPESAATFIKRIRAKRPARFQDASVRDDLDLAEIPESWSWSNLRFLLSPGEAFCYGVVQPGEDDPNGAFLVRAGDLVDGRIRTAALRRIPQQVHREYRRSQLVGGEVLVTVVGAGIGETAIAQSECTGFNIARAVAKLPVREFEARYVQLWLSSSRALGWMKGDSREVARPTLNLEQLQTLPVPIPPTPEQQEIVRRVESLFTLAGQIEARYAKAKAYVEKLTQSILAKAFRGELVPQDPNDEPAEALLRRIRQKRQNGKKGVTKWWKVGKSGKKS